MTKVVFAFYSPLHSSSRYAPGMPSALPNLTTVVECKGCTRKIPAASEAMAGAIRVKCPVCQEHRAYRVSTEVFLGRPHPDVAKKQRA
jgi:hypothetical protein